MSRANDLEELIRRQISLTGPLDIGTFMGLALGHPEHGYYMRKDPLGRAGDFTTAPEISQMFGEMVGAWCADIWLKLGRPRSFLLAECGPGRGTLMADILRASKGVPGFHEALSLHLIETSPALRARQASALAGYAPQFHDRLEDLPDSAPLILVANEFLDALPVRQFQKKADGGWDERVVGLNEDGALCFGLVPAALMPPLDAPPGDIVEMAPQRESFTEALARRIKAQSGAALLIDYGHERSAPGDTLQAVKDHRYSNILTDIGQADLTSHVDFERIAKAAQGQGVHIYGPARQGDFLRRLGVTMRAAALAQKAGPDQVRDIETALARLTGSDQDQMGSLFKVLALCHDQSLVPEGF